VRGGDGVSYTFRPAVREGVPLIVGVIGGTGGGKTYSAMQLAVGMSGGKPFAVIDSENGRAKHYADQFQFDHCDIRAQFRPQTYVDAIHAADKAGYGVIVVDSMSHVWAGDGGVLDWQDEELDRMAGSDYGKRENCKMAAWIKPKLAHKQMVQQLLQVKAHVILCFRAEEKIEMVKVDGKMKVVPKASATGKDGWIPVCEKSLPFELTASFLLLASNPGVPHPIKLQQQHKPFFPLDKPIGSDAGRELAQWAKGGAPVAATATSAATITDKQQADLLALCEERRFSIARVLTAAKVGAVSEILADRYEKIVAWVNEKTAAQTA
jgi:AAA domain